MGRRPGQSFIYERLRLESVGLAKRTDVLVHPFPLVQEGLLDAVHGLLERHGLVAVLTVADGPHHLVVAFGKPDVVRLLVDILRKLLQDILLQLPALDHPITELLVLQEGGIDP